MSINLTNSQAMGGSLINYISPATQIDSLSSEQVYEQLKKASVTTIYSFRTFFPFDLFPDEIVIDENKVNIIHQDFFFVYKVRSILITDITDVSVSTSIFYSYLDIIDSSNYRFPIEIRIGPLTRCDAVKARDVIQGLIAAKRLNLSLSHMPVDIDEEICQLGRTKGKWFKHFK